MPGTKCHGIFIPYPEDAEAWPTLPILPEAIERFTELANERTEAREGGELLPYEPRDTVRDPDGGRTFRLKHGDLVYFRPNSRGNAIAEIALSAIWRGRVEDEDSHRVRRAATAFSFFRGVDKELLPFNPDRTIITPAEQIFGFAEQGRFDEAGYARAFAGRVRFSYGVLRDAASVSPSGAPSSPVYMDPVTLKILDSQKPPCPALYFKLARGTARYISKRDLRPRQHHPQGRKFYLHHRSQDGLTPRRTEDPGEQAQQKVEITPIVQGTEFLFHVDFDNLSEWELGLLCYAVRPTADFRHKLGMGKPIGLGTVEFEPVGLFRVSRDVRYSAEGLFSSRYSQSWLADNEDPSHWPEYYHRERAAAAAGGMDFTALRSVFEDTMDLDIKKAIELLGRSDRLRGPVHTPQVAGQSVESETFQWFVENDRRGAAFLKALDRETNALPLLPCEFRE